ncbi:MAG: hypothetical protein M0Q88_03110 [Bacilli bacterium]|nr:hypothetical protein [Bacilli bacterium]
MLKNKVIAVDICNTIADLNRELDTRIGHNPEPSQYFHPGLIDKPNYFVENLDIFLDAKPIDGSIEVLNLLSKDNTIVYITARPKISEFVTRLWLRRHGYPMGKIYFTDNKVDIAFNLGVDIAIDDAPFELERYIKAGFNVLVKKHQYNTLFPNRFNWEELNMDNVRISESGL